MLKPPMCWPSQLERLRWYSIIATTVCRACNIETRYSGTIRERFGFIVGDSVLLYETAGIAWASNKVSLQYLDSSQNASEAHMQYGVAFGAGAEWAINSNLSAKVDYLYSYLTKEQYFSGTGNAAVAGWPLNTVRAGVNWRFN